ncbi:MAG: hypothetical protein DYG89_01065 [Caldilinea sp. CFX5]|nr:hypothetical protein [Caldilinea sp. CFX5]
MTTHFTKFVLTALIDRCQKERSQFQKSGTATSPACLEIFRRAFTNAKDHQAAWGAIHIIFEPMMRKWGNAMMDKTISEQAEIDLDDILQKAFLAFVRHAPQGADLLNHDSLGPVVQYLKKCTQSACLTTKRKYHGLTPPTSLEEFFEIHTQIDETAQANLRIDIKERLDELLENPIERLVFELRFECNVKPQEIFASYPDLFPTYQDVATVIQRLTRRLRKDPVLQTLHSPRQKSTDAAFLKISMFEEEKVNSKDISVDTPCPYDEVTLLDYLTGLTTTVIATAIENSVACRQAARQLAYELGPLLTAAHRLHCPDVETLIAYHQRELTGSKQLVISRHLQQCPLCQAELQMLKATDEEAIEPQPSIIRQVIEAIFQSPLNLAVRGDWLYYRTPYLMLNVNVRQSTGKSRTWILRTQLRTIDGDLVTEQVEQAILKALDKPAQAPMVATLIPGEPSLTFRELAAGQYALHVITASEEIVIRKITIGSDA